MSATVARLTARTLLGRRRVFVLLGLPAVLIALSLLLRALIGTDEAHALGLAWAFGFATLLPLLGLIAGTGVIAPEIGDGSIIYLLAKPIKRRSIIVAKFLIAAGSVITLGAVPILGAAALLSGEVGDLAIALFVGACAASVAYAALFLLLGVVTRNAVVVGLLYALVWEGVVASFVPGAQLISVQQWSLAISGEMFSDELVDRLNIDTAVSSTTGAIMLTLLVLGSLVMATRRLRRIRVISSDD